MAVLIVNADDFGLTEGISRGILKAHREGIVTSTSVLAVGPALGHVGGWLADAPALGVGVHLAAVGEDPPLLSAREIPTLVDGAGRLAPTWRTLLSRAMLGRVDRDDLRREFRAQLACVRALGRPVTHLDTHQHTHLFPVVRDVVVELAAEAGLAVRLVRSSLERWTGFGVNLFSHALARRLRAANVAHPTGFAGFDEAGALDEARLVRTLGRLAAGEHTHVELCTHPGEGAPEDRERYAWGYAWGRELEALVAPTVRRSVEQLGFELGTFATLPARQKHAPQRGGGSAS